MERPPTTGSPRRKNDRHSGVGCADDSRTSFHGGSGHYRFLFCVGVGDRVLSEALRQDGRGLLPGRAGDDCVGGWAGVCFGQPWFVGVARLGGFRLSIRYSCRALVLDRRHSRHGISGHRDDAFLLHFENAFGAWLSATALRSRGERAECRHVRDHDHPDVRREHVRHGRGDEGGPRLGHQLQHLGVIPDGGHLRSGRGAVLSHLQRSSAIFSDLVRRAPHPHSRFDRNGRMERHGRAHPAEFPGPGFHARLEHAGPVSGQSDGHALDGNCVRPRRGAGDGLLDHGLPGGAARALGKGHPLGQDGADHRFLFQDGSALDCDSPGLAWARGTADASGSGKQFAARAIQL